MSGNDYKSVPLEDLRKIYSEVDFKTDPYWHQMVTFTWALDQELDRIMLWMGIGCGKTLTSLYLSKLWESNRIFIVSPISVIPTWKEQIEQHTSWTYEVLDDYSTVRWECPECGSEDISTKYIKRGKIRLKTKTCGECGERGEAYHFWRSVRLEKLLSTDAKVVITSYNGLKYIFGREKLMKKRKFKKGQEKWEQAVCWKLNNELYDAVKDEGFDCMIADEIHRFRGPRTLQTRAGQQISRRMDKVVMMTGTPIANNAADLWAEYYVLNKGDTLGTSRKMFLNSYFWQTPWGGYTLRPECLDMIMERVAPVTLRMERKECIDLPEEIRETRVVKMGKKQADTYNQIDVEIQEAFEAGRLGKENVLIKAMLWAQVCGGFLDDWRIPGACKIPLLMETLEEVDGKVIIYHNFNEEGRIIEEALEGKYAFRSLRGEIPNKDKQLKDFQDDPRIRVLVANPQCGGEGLNLQMANTIIFYSLWYSGAHVRKQAEGRISRQGQENPCVFIDLIAENTIDEVIHESLDAKQHLADVVLDWLKDRGAKQEKLFST